MMGFARTSNRQDLVTIPVVRFLRESGGSSSMNVDGSITPVVFSFAPAAGEIFLVEFMRLVLLDSAIKGAANFGALATLTNGFLIEWSFNSVITEFNNISTNLEILCVFGSEYNDGATGNNMATENGAAYTGVVKFPIGRRITDADDVRVTVQDDLSAIGDLSVAILLDKVDT